MGMQLNRESFEDLVGAYALDACEPDEIVAIEAYITEHPEACEEVERLRAAAAWLGASGPLAPPPGLRANVLGDLATVPATGVDAYRELTGTLDAELDAVPYDAVERVTHNGLTVRQLIAHLDAIDRAFVSEMTADEPSGATFGAAMLEEVTAEALAADGDKPFDDVVRDWRSTTSTIVDAAAAAGPRSVMGFTADDALVIRAFETWMHLDDVRRRLDRPAYTPSAATLRAMADLSMQLLPAALAVTGRAHPGESLRMVLTGPGGKTWDVPMAPGEAVSDPPTVMTLDIVAWCRRFADRLDADEVPFAVDGNAALAHDVVAAAPAFAGL
jgi:uncharacterized protein (TIGR03083 family)